MEHEAKSIIDLWPEGVLVPGTLMSRPMLERGLRYGRSMTRTVVVQHQQSKDLHAFASLPVCDAPDRNDSGEPTGMPFHISIPVYIYFLKRGF